MPKFKGVSITIGEVDYVVPPLNFARLKELMPLIEEMQSMRVGVQITGKQAESIITIIHSALNRNYPEMNREEVEEMVDFLNMAEIIRGVMGVSGFVSGEPVAGSDQIGIKSTPT